MSIALFVFVIGVVSGVVCIAAGAWAAWRIRVTPEQSASTPY